MNKALRKSNIELLRILLMLMVIGVHYNLIGMGSAFLYTRLSGVNVSLTGLLEAFCIVCVDTFLIITGYFQINKNKIDKYKVPKFIIMILFFNIIQYLASMLIYKTSFNIKDFFIQAISGKWFIIIYLALYLLTPYINKLVNSLNKKEYKRLLLTIVIIFIIYQTAINYLSIFIPVIGWSGIIDKGIDSGYTILNFITLYLIGGYIRKNNISIRIKYSILGYLITTFIIFLSWYILFHSSYKDSASIAFYYNNIFVIASSVFIFLLFNRLSIKPSKIINYISKSTMSVFILSTSPFFIKIYDLLQVKKYSTTNYLIPHFIITCILIFMACSIVGIIGVYILEYTIFKLFDDKRIGVIRNMIRRIRKKKIKVVFLYQWIPGYIRFKDVVMKMMGDSRFEVKILAFPENIKSFKRNETYDYCEEAFPGVEAIDATAYEDWYDLKKDKPDYVFIQRPYDNYLPDNYSVEEISKYTKICYIPYGYQLAYIQDVSLAPQILNNISLFFAENDVVYEYDKKTVSGNKKTVVFNIGYPALDKNLKTITEPKSAFSNINKDEFKVIWTPRWSVYKEYYATTFFEYNSYFVNYAKKHKKLKLIFRPHPIMFNHFMDLKIMTKQQINKYIKSFPDNMYYDTQGDYFKTFIDSDVLVTDWSSILLDYFILGKPIILCGDNDETKYTKEMKKISNSSYKVSNWDELKEVLENLKAGIDPKKKSRTRFINEIKKTNDGRVAEKIVECIKNDFYK